MVALSHALLAVVLACALPVRGLESPALTVDDLPVHFRALNETELAKAYKPNAFQWQEGELEEIRKNDGQEPSIFDKFFGKK